MISPEDRMHYHFRYKIFLVLAFSSSSTVAPPHSPNLTSLHLRDSSFSNPSDALLTPQLILQPFRCFTYVIGTSPTSQLILQPFHRFTYITAHSPILPPLNLRHSSFYNPSAASPTSQVILQPFCCFTYVTGTSCTSPGEPPMHRETKNQSVVDSFVTASY